MLRKINKCAFAQFKTAINHYQILGVTRNSSSSQIKKKYYELAKIWHPDVCKQPDSHQKFNKISAAYEVLSDQAKRQQYDGENPFQYMRYNQNQNQKGDMPNRPNANFRSKKQQKAKGQQQDDPFMAYDQYFKKSRSFAKPKRGADANVNLSISLQESIRGVKKSVMFTQEQACPACQKQQKQMCFTCGGKKQIYNRVKRQKQTCTACAGRGYHNQCSTCQGQSFIRKDVTQNFYIPKNTHHKSIIRLEGFGHHGFKSDNGDLYVTIFVEDSKDFKVDGNNVYSECYLDFITATLGGIIKVKTIYGEEQVNVQAGTQSGKQLRLFNLGLTSQYSKRRGDHILTFKIKVPENLTQKQKQLLAALNL